MKKVMIIEDDADISRSLTIRLAHYGYEVSTACDGVLAMTQIQKVRPDLVCLDISMPGANGFQIAERIQNVPDLAATPIVFITASKRPEFHNKARDLGAVGYFEKPYEAADLLQCIHDAIGLYDEQNV